MNYPTTRPEREERRAHIRAVELQRAEMRAASLNRSITCGYPDEAWHGTCHGNTDPSACLCPCHDPDVRSVSVSAGRAVSERTQR